MLTKISVKGVQFHGISMLELLAHVKLRIANQKKTRLSFANPEFVVVAQHNPFLMNYLNTADYNLADGFGILFAARLYGKQLPERVTGTDFTQQMAALSAKSGYSIYLLGGKPGVAEKAARKLCIDHPGCRIVGIRDGFLGIQHVDDVFESINAAQPDFLMVCMGNPRQEEWIDRNFSRLNALIIFGNGGALDFASGNVKRAPIFIQRIGFEWLWRLFQDLTWHRLLRLARLPVFVILVFFDAILFRIQLHGDKD